MATHDHGRSRPLTTSDTFSDFATLGWQNIGWSFSSTRSIGVAGKAEARATAFTRSLFCLFEHRGLPKTPSIIPPDPPPPRSPEQTLTYIHTPSHPTPRDHRGRRSGGEESEPTDDTGMWPNYARMHPLVGDTVLVYPCPARCTRQTGPVAMSRHATERVGSRSCTRSGTDVLLYIVSIYIIDCMQRVMCMFAAGKRMWTTRCAM